MLKHFVTGAKREGTVTISISPDSVTTVSVVEGAGISPRSILCITRSAPWAAPHITYIHEAPCQKPPITMVANWLKYALALEHLLPPNGM